MSSKEKSCKIYLVAGEPSGDLLGAGLIGALLRACPGAELRGVGGESMAACGLKSLFDIKQTSIMGFFEVFPKIPLMLKLIRRTAEDIEAWRPDVIVTIDSWGFVDSLLGRLRKRGVKIPMVHYVAPQVWAWKKGRAKKVAARVDRLMTLLPDEGKYFEKYGLRCDFVGHPVIERMSNVTTDQAQFRADNGISPGSTVICTLPGSRSSEIKKMIPIFRRSLGILRERYGDFTVVVPTVGAIEEKVRRGFSGMDMPVVVVTGADARYNALAASRTAIAASGTVSLELTALGTPHLIAYTFNALTNFAIRFVLHIRFANLINLLADREIIPEFVLHNCRPELIAAGASRLLDDPAEGERQVADAREAMQRLRLPDILPSDRAAQIVLETMISD